MPSKRASPPTPRLQPIVITCTNGQSPEGLGGHSVPLPSRLLGRLRPSKVTVLFIITQRFKAKLNPSQYQRPLEHSTSPTCSLTRMPVDHQLPLCINLMMQMRKPRALELKKLAQVHTAMNTEAGIQNQVGRTQPLSDLVRLSSWWQEVRSERGRRLRREQLSLLVSVRVMRPSTPPAQLCTHPALCGLSLLTLLFLSLSLSRLSHPQHFQMCSEFVPRSLIPHLAGSNCAILLDPLLRPCRGSIKPHHPRGVKIVSIL